MHLNLFSSGSDSHYIQPPNETPYLRMVHKLSLQESSVTRHRAVTTEKDGKTKRIFRWTEMIALGDNIYKIRNNWEKHTGKNHTH